MSSSRKPDAKGNEVLVSRVVGVDAIARLLAAPDGADAPVLDLMAEKAKRRG